MLDVLGLLVSEYEIGFMERILILVCNSRFGCNLFSDLKLRVGWYLSTNYGSSHCFMDIKHFIT